MGDAAQPRVAVIMGSDSDWSVMVDAAAALAEFGIPHEVRVVSAPAPRGRCSTMPATPPAAASR